MVIMVLDGLEGFDGFVELTVPLMVGNCVQLTQKVPGLPPSCFALRLMGFKMAATQGLYHPVVAICLSVYPVHAGLINLRDPLNVLTNLPNVTSKCNVKL